jgi:hypothetical protein
MIQSELLKEKHRVQALISKESASIREYLINANIAAKEIAKLHGVNLKYAEMPIKTLQRTLLSSRR